MHSETRCVCLIAEETETSSYSQRKSVRFAKVHTHSAGKGTIKTLPDCYAEDRDEAMVEGLIVD